MENVELKDVEPQEVIIKENTNDIKELENLTAKSEENILLENKKSLLVLLKTMLIEDQELSGSVLNKINIKLNEKDKEILSTILEHSPKVFDNIEEAMKRIIVDNKVDSKDIPDLLFCIQELYQLIYMFKSSKMDTKKRCEICATIVKMSIHILVEERIIKVDDDKKVMFLYNIDCLVDSAINLIGLSKVIKPSGCLKKLFGKHN